MEYLRVADHRLECDWVGTTGERSSALVFLHQGLGSVTLWRDFADAVATSSGCRGFLYSRRGHGQSDPLVAPYDAQFMHDEALRVLPQVLALAGISKPILVGHSDGGSIAVIHAGSQPDSAVRGLVLEAPHIFVEDVTIENITRMRDDYASTDLKERLERHHGSNTEATFRAWNDVWLSPVFRDWNIQAFLDPIDCPVMVIQGEDDEYGTDRQVEAIVEQVSGEVESILLPGCGHIPHRDCRDTVVRAITRFVRSTVEH